ncbi:MAG TPA: hypothetical protein VMV49_10485 [Candidatus Deferrimicrobium sp.]|nr:hypothetical protein [Candidatus Deferrimicrobium sp.]
MILQKVQEEFFKIASEIISELGPILSTRPYLAIANFQGDFKYIEDELENYKDFIATFVKTNFSLLEVGDHSMPISGTNLAFFKVSEKAVIVIYIKKGLLGQLLIFKARMIKYQSRIDELIPEVPSFTEPLGVKIEEPEIQKEKPHIIPILLRQIDKKAKFPLQEVIILNYCDGKNNLEDIIRESNLEKQALWEILDKYTKKGWIEITYPGNPTLIPVLTKEIPPMAVQLGVVNKKEFEISKLCDGKNTIEDIQDALDIPREELDPVIEKMRKNSIIHLEIK